MVIMVIILNLIARKFTGREECGGGDQNDGLEGVTPTKTHWC